MGDGMCSGVIIPGVMNQEVRNLWGQKCIVRFKAWTSHIFMFIALQVQNFFEPCTGIGGDRRGSATWGASLIFESIQFVQFIC
jgi:hypothetical protein